MKYAILNKQLPILSILSLCISNNVFTDIEGIIRDCLTRSPIIFYFFKYKVSDLVLRKLMIIYSAITFAFPIIKGQL